MTQGHETKVSNFDAWVKTKNGMVDTWVRGAKSGFEAGAASRQNEVFKLQTEIDQLQKRVKELELINFDSELHFDAAKEHIDHLKQRLVDVLNTIDSSEEISHMLYRKVYKILKGESNE